MPILDWLNKDDAIKESARAIDMHEQVEFWVRNLERKEGHRTACRWRTTGSTPTS
jgi:hypothetical protein